MSVGVVGCCRCCPGGVLTAGGGTSPLLAEVPMCVAGWWVGLGPPGVLVADGVVLGGVAVMAVVDAQGCCW